MLVASGGEPGAADPVAIPAAAPLAEELKAPAQPKAHDMATATAKAEEPSAPAPKAAEPKTLAAPVPEQAKPKPASPKPVPVSAYSTGGDRDCSDFGSQGEAQRFFLANGGPASDPHKLDRDHDGLACEST